MSDVRIVLAIDEDVSRYSRMVRALARGGMALVQTVQPTVIDHVLQSDGVAAVLLDYDMPDHKGTYYLERFLLTRDIPVLVTSANPTGADELVKLLEDHGLTYGQISARRDTAVADWLDWLAANALD